MNTTELLKAASIYARDMLTLNVTSRQERLEPRFVQRTPAAIVPRGNLILVSFGNVRAVVGLENLFLLDAHRPVVQDFASELVEVFSRRGEYQAGIHMFEDSPQYNELVFLEGLLRDTVESFNRRVRLYDPIVNNFLDKVSSDVYSNTGVHLLAPLKDSLQSFEIQVTQSVDCLADLLDDDDAMLNLLLTEKKAAAEAGTEVDFSRHEHVELLLGVYARQLSVILQEIRYMLGRLQSKQEFVALAMAGYRNRMVRMNVHISIAGLSLAVGTTVAGFFGMNLISGLETSPFAFYYVMSVTSISGLVVCMTSLNYISGNTMKMKAQQRLDEIETLASALSDMCALDYTLKHTAANKHIRLNKEDFHSLLRSARRSRDVTDQEVSLLFDVFDKVKDGEIGAEDLSFLEFMQSGLSEKVVKTRKKTDHVD
eukprot:CAMPEP_0198146100 /NCGR_PEP_ID=MMETSP1443-20131203/27411_1 /TAXON_ID=186043 /ORGANISM="Entomoneis sp., Strain CCMP2396" /LENGTH=425 /DNA_ID=CAMNT_0043809935 /DNA_START=437 /DNA_END=1714 /DNA_ORIENTATION=+